MESLYKGTFTAGNFLEAFKLEVDKLVKQEMEPEFKNKFIEALIETYWEEVGRIPEPYQLERLATWLVEDKSKNPDKVSNTEYPILSDSQMKLRKRRELSSDYIAVTSDSAKHRINGTRKPKIFKVFGDYETI